MFQVNQTLSQKGFMIIAIAALFLLVGLGALMAARKQLNRRRELLRWPEIEGKILRREVAASGRPGGGPPAFRKEAKITFQEPQSGVVSSSIFPESPISDARTIERWMDRFPERVPLRKNPENPSDIVLLHGKAGLIYVIYAVGLLALLMGIAIAALAF